MIRICFEVWKIDYEKIFESMLPQLTEECRAKTEQNELEKLIDRLGPDTVPLMKKLIGFLDTDTRDQIIVWLIESQRDTLVSTANKAMHDLLGGDAVVIGDLYAQDEPGTRMSLQASKVKIDSGILAESPALTGITGGLAKLILRLSEPETIEKEAIKLLSSDYVKPKIISSLTDGLREAGLHITLLDLKVMEDSGDEKLPRMMDPEKDEGLLPDAIEDKIIDALVAWLKEIL